VAKKLAWKYAELSDYGGTVVTMKPFRWALGSSY
jgi:hypothetical protein